MVGMRITPINYRMRHRESGRIAVFTTHHVAIHVLDGANFYQGAYDDNGEQVRYSNLIRSTDRRDWENLNE